MQGQWDYDHRHDNKIDGFKDNKNKKCSNKECNADAWEHSKDVIENVNKLNDKCKHNDRDKKKSKIFKMTWR